MKRIMVVGGGYAGLMAMTRIRALDRSVELLLVDPGDTFTERIRLHEVLAGVDRPRTPYASLCAALGARHLRGRATAAHPGYVTVDGTDHVADAVIVALGGRPRPLAGATPLADPAVLGAVREGLVGGVSVVGAGFTGLETATELAARRPELDVTLVRRRSSWQDLSPRGAWLVDRRLADLGITVRSAPVPGQPCINATGYVPHHLPGLPTTPDGRVRVDDHLATSDGLFVAGDMASPPGDPGTGCASALPMGAIAGENAVRRLAGRPLRRFGFARPIVAASLGPGHALLQGYHDGRPTWALSGRVAGLVKALLLRYVPAMLAAERWIRRPLYRWPGAL
jgi:NADH dehydrogenase FAD-containing subunit